MGLMYQLKVEQGFNREISNYLKLVHVMWVETVVIYSLCVGTERLRIPFLNPGFLKKKAMVSLLNILLGW